MHNCVKRALLIVPLILGLILFATPAKAQIGFVTGYGANLFSGPSFTSAESAEFESNGSFNLGMFYDFRFSRVTFRPGIFIRQVDFDWKLSGLDPAFFPLSEDLRVAEFPLDFLIHFPTPKVDPYVVLGPSFNFVHTDQPDLRQSLDREKGSTSFTSFTLGAGIELAPQGWGVLFFPEIRYSLALSGFLSEDYTVRTINYAADSSEKLSSLTFRLGISLPSY